MSERRVNREFDARTRERQQRARKRWLAEQERRERHRFKQTLRALLEVFDVEEVSNVN